MEGKVVAQKALEEMHKPVPTFPNNVTVKYTIQDL